MEHATLADKIFYLAIAGFVAGIFARSFVKIGAAFSFLLIFLGVILFALFVVHSRNLPVPSPLQSGRGSVVLFSAVFFFAAGLGMLRYDLADRNGARSWLEPQVHQTVTLEGVVADEPDVRESVTRLVLKVTSEFGATKVLLTVLNEPRYGYGDRVTVEGKLERPKNFSDEQTLREVNYVSHLAKDGIYFEMFRPRVTLQKHGEGNAAVGSLFAFKGKFIARIRELVPEPHASLLGGLIVGAKQSLGKKLLDDFRTVGIIHIVVLSGYNITIVARFIEWLFSRMRRGARLALAAGAMIIFAVMVGAGATVVRATIMALLVVLAEATGRLYAVTRALLVAGVIMLLHNPQILVFDTSFQLSFLATVGLIYLSPLVEPKVTWLTNFWKLREVVVATVATQVFVLPFLLYKTGTLSLVALPVNLLILAAIPATMLLGFLAGLVGFFSGMLAAPFAFLSYALLAYQLAVVEWFAKLPFAALSLSSFPLWLAIVWYGIYAVILISWHKKQSTGPFKENLLS